MRSTTPTRRLNPLAGLAIAALAAGVLLIAGAAAAEARTVIFKDGLGASAQVTWDTSGGTLKYYGTVFDKKGDGYSAKIFRVNGRSAPREIATATFGGRKDFGSAGRPLQTSLPAHFRVCTYNRDAQIRCTERFSDAAAPNLRRHRYWKCNSPWTKKVSTEGWASGLVMSVFPTRSARREGRSGNVQRQLWQDVQRCVNLTGNASFGMNGDQIHMMRLQLDCHAFYGLTRHAGGPTWDLEANTRKMSRRRLFFVSFCNTK
jgi:hypothetical protein